MTHLICCVVAVLPLAMPNAQEKVNDLIDVAFDQVPAVQAIESILKGRSFVIHPGIKGKVTYTASGVDRIEALKAVLFGQNAEHKQRGSIVWVESKDHRIEADPDSVVLPIVSVKSLEVRDILLPLCRAAGRSYSVGPDVMGTITITMKNQPLLTVLKAALNQVDATYRMEFGILAIMRKPLPDHPLPVYRISIEEVSAERALLELGSFYNVEFKVDPSIKGKVTLHMRQATFDQVLAETLDQAKAHAVAEPSPHGDPFPTIYRVMPGTRRAPPPN